MKTVLVLGRKHNSNKVELVAGPSSDGVEAAKIVKDFKVEMRSKRHETFSVLEFWDSIRGRVKVLKFLIPQKPTPKGNMKTIASIIALFAGLTLGSAQEIQYLLNNSTIPIGASNVVTCVAVTGQKIAVQTDMKLTGAGTSGIAFILEASNNNTNWSTTPVQFWRAANGSTAVSHLTNFDVGPYQFLRWTIHNTNSVAVTNSTITMSVKKEGYR